MAKGLMVASHVIPGPKDPRMFELVMSALKMKGRLPRKRAYTGVPKHLRHSTVSRLYLEPHDGGWIANVEFTNVPAGKPNTVGTPDAFPIPSPRDAFLFGAGLLSKIVTGSDELPFFVVDDKLIVAGYQ